MDGTTLIIIVAILALLVLVGLLKVGKKFEATIKGPGGMGLDLKGSNEPPADPPAGAKITDAKSHTGAIQAQAEGGPAQIERAEAQGDIKAVSTSSQEQPPPKKA